jgi:hypothetical protein
MANNLDAFIPRVLAMAVMTLRESVVLPGKVYSSFGSEYKTHGSSVDIPLPASMIAEDVVPSNIPSVGQNITPKSISLKLDGWIKSGFPLTDLEYTSVMDGVVPVQLKEAARAIANRVDTDLWSMYKSVPNVIGTAGQVPFQNVTPPTQTYHLLNAAKESRRILNLNRALQNDRIMLLGVEAEANASALPQFLSAADSGSTETIREGRIGYKYGFDWFMSQNSPLHANATTGTVVTNGSPPTVNGVGATTLVVSGATAIGIGDKFSIAGDTTQYTINAGSSTTNWLIYPALKVAPATSTAITIYDSGASGADVSLAFHPMAFAFANRPLIDVMANGNTIQTLTDPDSGLSMRLEIVRQNKQTLVELDFLYGYTPLLPELAVAIYG